jgi:hypothetical protein
MDGIPGGSWLDCQAGWRSGTEGDEASDDAGGETHSVERGLEGPISDGRMRRGSKLGYGCLMDELVEELMVELMG